jgi:hypothetical protein
VRARALVPRPVAVMCVYAHMVCMCTHTWFVCVRTHGVYVYAHMVCMCTQRALVGFSASEREGRGGVHAQTCSCCSMCNVCVHVCVRTHCVYGYAQSSCSYWRSSNPASVSPPPPPHTAAVIAAAAVIATTAATAAAAAAAAAAASPPALSAPIEHCKRCPRTHKGVVATGVLARGGLARGVLARTRTRSPCARG